MHTYVYFQLPSAANNNNNDNNNSDSNNNSSSNQPVQQLQLVTPADKLICYVCELDTTWSYITHSAATRAYVSHVCSACQRYCCSICAPAGEKIPGFILIFLFDILP